MVRTPDGIYDVRPTGTRRIASGRLAAVGPIRLLVSQCDQGAGCHPVVLGPTFAPVASKPEVPVPISAASAGVISPDGRVAALITSGSQPVMLIDLKTGSVRRVDVDAKYSPGFSTSTICFSPDGRWVFLIGADGQVRTVDVRTGEVRTLLPSVMDVQQIALRR